MYQFYIMVRQGTRSVDSMFLLGMGLGSGRPADSVEGGQNHNGNNHGHRNEASFETGMGCSVKSPDELKYTQTGHEV
jgi:hypothetical protein